MRIRLSAPIFENPIPLVVIAGPTATGKSEVAVEVALRLDGEIISADSMQVYRGMDIGTAKLSPEERKKIPHHLIDVVDPAENYSVANFQEQASQLIKDIHSRNKLPILAGGTGLYINAVIDDYYFPSGLLNSEVRQHLAQIGKEMGPEALHRRLAEIDPESAARIQPNDLRRIVRALEVFHLTGQPLSTFHRKKDFSPPRYHLAMFGLYCPRHILYERINQRVEEMVRRGLVEEVKKLLREGCAPSATALQAVGYKEIIDYLHGYYNLETAVELIKRNTRRLAKRQMTWFKRDKRIRWFDITQFSSPQHLAAKICKEICDTFNSGVK